MVKSLPFHSLLTVTKCICFFVSMLCCGTSIRAQTGIQSVTLTRIDCQAKCEEYQITLFANGDLLWNGIRNVSRRGMYSAHIRKAEADKMLQAFSSERVKRLLRHYARREKGKSYLKMDIKINGEDITIGGVQAAPDDLRRLAAQMEASARKVKWVVQKFVPPVVSDKPVSLFDASEANINNSVAQYGADNALTDDNEIKNKSIPDKDILTYADEMPEYPGGPTAMIQFMQTHIQYPEVAREGSVQGKVYCRFVVDETGKIGQVQVLKGPGYGLDQEAMRVIRMMPRWKPGTMQKKPVKVYYTLPVNFVLR